MALTASGSVAITAGADSASFSRKDESSGFLSSRLDKVEDGTGTVVGSTVSAGKDVTVTAQSGDVTVQASKLQAGEQLALKAEDGQVQLLTGKDSSTHAETHTSSNAVWQTMEDKVKNTSVSVSRSSDGNPLELGRAKPGLIVRTARTPV